jgi:hypothetical protein
VRKIGRLLKNSSQGVGAFEEGLEGCQQELFRWPVALGVYVFCSYSAEVTHIFAPSMQKGYVGWPADIHGCNICICMTDDVALY